MTDSFNFSMIESTKKRIEKMGIKVNITHNQSIVLYSEWFEVVITKDPGYKVTSNKIFSEMDMEGFEDYSAEIDNLNRAILWVNTQIKTIVFNL